MSAEPFFCSGCITPGCRHRKQPGGFRCAVCLFLIRRRVQAARGTDDLEQRLGLLFEASDRLNGLASAAGGN